MRGLLMKLHDSVWGNVISGVGIAAVLGFLMSEFFGAFFLALGGAAQKVGDPSTIGLLGRIFGCCLITLFWIGAVLIPGELTGLVRFYRRGTENQKEHERLARKLLLTAISIFSIGCAVSLSMIVARFAR